MSKEVGNIQLKSMFENTRGHGNYNTENLMIPGTGRKTAYRREARYKQADDCDCNCCESGFCCKDCCNCAVPRVTTRGKKKAKRAIHN